MCGDLSRGTERGVAPKSDGNVEKVFEKSFLLSENNTL
jgi:hypothetical protein